MPKKGYKQTQEHKNKNIGKPPSFKGKKHSKEMKEKMSKIKKEQWKNPLYRIKMLKRKQRKYTLEHKEKARQRWLKDKNPRWKGDNIKYGGLHDWIILRLGQPDKCEFCGKTGLKGRFIQWANKTGKYLRDLDDWIRLCAKCHYHYDKKYKNNFGKNNHK